MFAIVVRIIRMDLVFKKKYESYFSTLGSFELLSTWSIGLFNLI